MSHLVATLALLTARALTPELEVTVEPRQLTVGDRAALTLRLRLPAELPAGDVSWPHWERSVGGVEILAVGPLETVELEGGERLLTQTLDITVFEVGEAVVPSIGLEVAAAEGPRRLSSDEIRLDVVSVLPEDEAEPQARPPAPPRPPEIGERFWWTSGALAAACCAALALLLQHGGRGGAAPVAAPVLSPRQELDRSLAALAAERDVASLYAGLSMATRRYLGRALDFAAPESTTSEIARTLKRLRLDAELVARTARLLTACDMVKFAASEPGPEAARERIGESESIADGIDEWLRPAEPEPEEAA